MALTREAPAGRHPTVHRPGARAECAPENAHLALGDPVDPGQRPLGIFAEGKARIVSTRALPQASLPDVLRLSVTRGIGPQPALHSGLAGLDFSLRGDVVDVVYGGLGHRRALVAAFTLRLTGAVAALAGLLPPRGLVALAQRVLSRTGELPCALLGSGRP